MQKNSLTLDSLLSLNEDEREQELSQLSDTEAAVLLFDWFFWARENQRIRLDEDWFIWLILTGRGWGKTRTGAESIRYVVENNIAGRLALIAPTSADGRDVIVEGESGILSVSPPWFYPKFEPSKRRITWPNGAVATLFSSEEPERLRGPQHDFFWGDEFRAWSNPVDCWDNLMLGMRIGKDPRGILTTTPRMGMPLMRELIQRSDVKLTTGHMQENLENLAQPFFQAISKYEGTTLGKQEIEGILLEYVEGALWTKKMIEDNRDPDTSWRDMERIVIAVDPQTSGKGKVENAETGIVVSGIKHIDDSVHGYLLDDLSKNASPNEWGQAVVDAYKRYHASAVVVETNQGGAMVTNTLRNIDDTINITDVHAVHSKRARAEPVANLYEQGRIHHVRQFVELEEQQSTWTPGEPSPDRLDALVWSFTDLIFENQSHGEVEEFIEQGRVPINVQEELQYRNPREGTPQTTEDAVVDEKPLILGPDETIAERMRHVNGYIIVAHDQ